MQIFKSLAALFATIVFTATFAAGCIFIDKSNPISKVRPLGCRCGPNDSATVRKAFFHPKGPTGGWHGGEHDKVDYNRTIERDTNCLIMKDGNIRGFVRFDTPGYLQARSYDDLYGDVYCGWSPNKLPLKPTNKHVFVSLGYCSVGDGGLDQVTEVCWFPESSSDGILVFSSAQPSPEPKLSAADTYCPELLGNTDTFNDQLASDVISEFLRKGDLASAEKVIGDSIAALKALRHSVSGENEFIPAKETHRRDWAMIQSFELGLLIGEPSFSKKYQELIDTLSSTSHYKQHGCEIYERMHPIYLWCNDKIVGKTAAELNIPAKDGDVCGHEPQIISEYLQSASPNEAEFLRKSSTPGEFWTGIHKYLKGERQNAHFHFEKFLSTERFSHNSEFEVAAASKLLNGIRHTFRKAG